MLKIFYYFFGFALAVSIIPLFEIVFTGRFLFMQTNFDDFNARSALNHLTFLTKASRIVGSKHYNESIDYILNTLEVYRKEAKRDFKYNLFETHNFYYMTNDIHAVRKFIKTIEVNFTFSSNESRTLFISAHVDGHSTGTTTYDDAINVATMLEMVSSISKEDFNYDYNIHFIFIGGEEFGMEGSKAYVKYHNISGHNLNLESIGSGRPFCLTTKAKKSSSVVKTWAKVKGVIGATFFNDVMGTGLVRSSSDLRIFEENNLSGAELVYIGNPAFYHTKYDVLLERDDVKYQGLVLMDFLHKFEIDDNEKNQIILGFTPFILTFSYDDIKIINMALIIVLLTSMVPIIKKSIFGAFKTLFVVILMIVATMTIVHDFNKKNPVGYADYPLCSSIFLPLMIFVFGCTILGYMTVSQKSILLVRGIFDITLAILTMNLDSGLLVSTWLIATIIMINIRKAPRLLKIFIEAILMIPMTFTFYLLYRTLLRYIPHVNGIIADIAMIAICLLYAIKLFFAFTPSSTASGNNLTYHWILFAIPSLLIMFITMKDPPYNSQFTLKGCFSQYIYENRTSIVSFMPEAGKNVINHLMKINPHVKSSMKFKKGTVTLPAVYKKYSNVSLPDFVNDWPEHHVSFEDGELTVNIPSNAQNVDTLYLIVRCKDNEKCITEVEGYDEVSYFPNNIVEFRIAPLGENAIVKMKATSSFDLEVIFHFFKHTKYYNGFVASFPSYVVDFAKNRHISDTCLVSEYSF